MTALLEGIPSENRRGRNFNRSNFITRVNFRDLIQHLWHLLTLQQQQMLDDLEHRRGNSHAAEELLHIMERNRAVLLRAIEVLPRLSQQGLSDELQQLLQPSSRAPNTQREIPFTRRISTPFIDHPQGDYESVTVPNTSRYSIPQVDQETVMQFPRANQHYPVVPETTPSEPLIFSLRVIEAPTIQVELLSPRQSCFYEEPQGDTIPVTRASHRSWAPVNDQVPLIINCQESEALQWRRRFAMVFMVCLHLLIALICLI